MILFLTLLACETKTVDTGTEPGTADGGSTTTPGCTGTADGELPEGSVELSWDDGSPTGSVVGQGWSIADTSLEDSLLHQWVRFEPQDRVRVVGVSTMLVNLPADPLALVPLSLWPDFGANGFDAWHEGPLWSGTRCAGELSEGQWHTWVLDEPVEVQAGTLVYAGHRREGPDDPAIPFDAASAGDGSCALWDDCRSALNMPDLTSFVSGGYSYSFWKGYSFSLQYDLLVRLHVEVVEHIPEEDKQFTLDTTLPTGSRQAWGDYDDDGWDDIYVPGALYRNEGGSFRDVTDESGLGGLASSGGVWGDYDNDGCLDLFVFAESYTSGDTLMRSTCDGGFEDVTVAAGLDDSLDGSDACAATHRSTAAAAWLDLDGDGLLDLYNANFLCWTDYSEYVDQLWLNQGDGTFLAMGGEQGLSSSAQAARGVNPVDADLDGDVDLLINHYVLQRNWFYDNQGDGTVVEAAREAGLGGNGVRYELSTTFYYGHTIGTAWGDLDNDGDWDSVQANLAHPRFFDFSDKTQILMQEDGVWTDNAGDWADPVPDNGLRYQETHSVPTLGDFDSDGNLDLAITAVYPGRPTDFYWGQGDGSFRFAWQESGILTEDGWGMTASDLDNDGDLDLSISGGTWRNQGPQGNWVQVRPRGVWSNRAAIGAIVTVETADGSVRMRQVQGGTGQGEQDSAFLHFGLGEASEISRLTVSFIGGETVSWQGPIEAGQRLWAQEDGTLSTGWSPGG